MPLFRRSDDNDRLAFKIADKLAAGDYTVVQGVFNTTDKELVTFDSDRVDSVFICYRRQDTQWAAVGIREELVRHLGARRVFMDVSSIEPGVDFVEAIYAALARCRVVLALVGPRWSEPTIPGGTPRIAEPGDYVRLELETSLALKRRIVPVLVDGARMPTMGQLPPSLAGLSRRQAIEIAPADFSEAVRRLVHVIEGA